MDYRIIVLTTASVLVFIDVILLVFYKKLPYEKTGLKVFLAEDLFFLGGRLFAAVGKGTGGKRIRKLEEIYDREFAGRAAKSAAAAPYTYASLFVPAILCIFAVTENAAAAVLMTGLMLFLMFYFDLWLDNALKVRRSRILREFATVLSKMSLLVNAGLTAKDAFCRVANSADGILYGEMRRTVNETENGRRTDDALDDFSFRCGSKEVRKFVSLYKQNLSKGGPEFPLLLAAMAENARKERMSRAKIAGAAAEQKLLFPIILMFIGVLIIVIIPAFNNLF